MQSGKIWIWVEFRHWIHKSCILQKINIHIFLV